MPIHIWQNGEQRTPQPLEHEALPLGAVVVVDHFDDHDALAVATLCRLAAASPWVQVVCDPPAVWHLNALLPVSTRVVSVEVMAQVGAPVRWRTPARAAMADVPSLQDFLSHIICRLGPVAGAMVTELFSGWCGTVRYHRAFRRLGLPTPNDWYDLWLQLFAQGRVAPSTTSVTAMARIRHLTVPELSAQLERIFRTPWREATALPWTARIELFLRAAGLSGACPSDRARHRRFEEHGLRRVAPGPRRALYVARGSE